MKIALSLPYTTGYKDGKNAVENDTRSSRADQVADVQLPYYREGYRDGAKDAAKSRN